MKKSLKELISFYSEQFEGKTRDNGERYVIIGEKGTDELREAVKEAHGEGLPSDFVYGTFADSLQSLEDYIDLETMEDMENIEYEIIDGQCDIYTKGLTEWLNSDISNVYYLTEVLEETDVKDGFQLLVMAQARQVGEVFSSVKKFLEEQLEAQGE